MQPPREPFSPQESLQIEAGGRICTQPLSPRLVCSGDSSATFTQKSSGIVSPENGINAKNSPVALGAFIDVRPRSEVPEREDSFDVPPDSSHRSFRIPTTPIGNRSPRTPDEQDFLARVFSPPPDTYALSLPSFREVPESRGLEIRPPSSMRPVVHPGRNDARCSVEAPMSQAHIGSSRSSVTSLCRWQPSTPILSPVDPPSPILSEASSSTTTPYKSSAKSEVNRKNTRSSRNSNGVKGLFRSQRQIDLHNTKDQRSLSSLLNMVGSDHRVSATATSLDVGIKDSGMGTMTGIHVTTLIECCAANLKSSVADANHGRSSSRFDVDILDDFISHSWRGSRWLKYFALVLIYNNEAALALCAISSIITFLLWKHLPSISEHSPIKSYCCGVGFLVYFLAMQCYQRVRQLLCLRLNTAFLDKLCIDQTDEETMRNGISRLSFFLVNSRRMVILWDRTYFTRAWCVFEVAAREHFFKINGCGDNTNIILVPLQLACIVSMLCISVWVSSAALLICLNLEVNELVALQRLTTMGVAMISSLLCGFCAAMVGRQYARDKRHLKDTLLQFSWEGAECHDQRDYEAISMLLLHWFGSICEFDMYVCGEFRQRVLRQLGGKDGLKLKFTLPVCMAVFCCVLDFVAYTTHSEPRHIAGHISLWLFLITASFAVVPLVFKIFLRLCGLLQVQRSSWFVDAAVNLLVWLLTLLCIVLAIGIPAILDRLYFSRREVVWFVLQILVDMALVATCAWNYRDSLKHASDDFQRKRFSFRRSQFPEDASIASPSAAHVDDGVGDEVQRADS